MENQKGGKYIPLLRSSKTFYEAVGVLTTLASCGIGNALWMNYYTFRLGKDIPTSDAAQLQELQRRFTSHLDKESTVNRFWEVRQVGNLYTLLETYPLNVVWNEGKDSDSVYTFCENSQEEAIEHCCTVLNIPIEKLAWP